MGLQIIITFLNKPEGDLKPFGSAVLKASKGRLVLFALRKRTAQMFLVNKKYSVQWTRSETLLRR